MKLFKLFGVALCLFLIVGCYQTSSGSRTGELVKFSEKGFLYNSGEGDIVMNVFNMKSQNKSMTGQSGNVFHFSVANDNPRYKELCDKLDSLNGKFVKISYVEEWIVSPFRANTKYLVTNVEPM